MSLLILILAAILIAGIGAYFIRTAPFIDEKYKASAQWVLLLFLVIFVVSRLWPYVVSHT